MANIRFRAIRSTLHNEMNLNATPVPPPPYQVFMDRSNSHLCLFQHLLLKQNEYRRSATPNPFLRLWGSWIYSMEFPLTYLDSAGVWRHSGYSQRRRSLLPDYFRRRHSDTLSVDFSAFPSQLLCSRPSSNVAARV